MKKMNVMKVRPLLVAVALIGGTAANAQSVNLGGALGLSSVTSVTSGLLGASVGADASVSANASLDTGLLGGVTGLVGNTLGTVTSAADLGAVTNLAGSLAGVADLSAVSDIAGSVSGSAAGAGTLPGLLDLSAVTGASASGEASGAVDAPAGLLSGLTDLSVLGGVTDTVSGVVGQVGGTLEGLQLDVASTLLADVGGSLIVGDVLSSTLGVSGASDSALSFGGADEPAAEEPEPEMAEEPASDVGAEDAA